MNSKMLTTGQAARLCSVTPDTVLKWIRSGRLVATRTPGGHHRVSMNELLKVLKGFADKRADKEAVALAQSQFRYCWEFNGKGKLLNGCRECIVYTMRAKRCYEVVDRAKEIGHNKLFCKQSCLECEYYKAVRSQAVNVLIVTDNDVLARDLKRGASDSELNLEVTQCEYTTSALVDRFRPDFAVVDCSLGKQATSDICSHLMDDPRIPFVRVVLAAGQGEFPGECEKEVFARIEKPFSIQEIAECVSGNWKPAGDWNEMTIAGDSLGESNPI